MFVQNIIKLIAAVHDLSCAQAFFALCRNGKESENPVLWPWSLTRDLEILWISSGCQDTCFCKISSSCVQRFVSYRANWEKKTPTKTIQSVATARTATILRGVRHYGTHTAMTHTALLAGSLTGFNFCHKVSYTHCDSTSVSK